MSAQRYSHPTAHKRMADGLCPECGELPSMHYGEASVAAMFAPCNLLARGVTERIEQYRADEIERGAS